MKRIFIISMAVIAFLLACGQKEMSSEGVQTKKPVRVKADTTVLYLAVTPTLDCLPLFVAKDQGLFSHEGVKVSLKMYQAQMDQDTALLRHHVEGLTTDRERMKWLQQQGTAVSEVATTTLKWQLISNKTARIKLLRQLDDKMVAMTRFSATDRLMNWAIDSVGLKQERVFRIQVNDVGVRLGMLENGIMDAMLLPEPQATQARLGGHYVIFDTDSLGWHLGVIAFTQQAMADTMRQRQIEAFLKVYNAACDTIRQNGLKRYRDIIVSTCHARPQTVDSIRTE